MRRYESIVIIDPDLSKENCAIIFKKLNDLIEKYGGLLVEIDDWGIKKIAYEIKNKVRGHYVRFDFCCKVEVINEMEHYFKINDSVLKFMTIVLDRTIDIVAIKNTIAQKEKDEKETSNNSEKQKENAEFSKSENEVNEEE